MYNLYRREDRQRGREVEKSRKREIENIGGEERKINRRHAVWSNKTDFDVNIKRISKKK